MPVLVFSWRWYQTNTDIDHQISFRFNGWVEQEVGSPAADTTITDRVYFDLMMCPSLARSDRTLGNRSVICMDGEDLGRIVIGLYGKQVCYLSESCTCNDRLFSPSTVWILAIFRVWTSLMLWLLVSISYHRSVMIYSWVFLSVPVCIILYGVKH